jgi:hypothetical protein
MTKRERKIPAKKKKNKKLGNNNNNKIHKVEKKTYGVSCFEMIYARHRQLSKTKRKPVSL